MRLQPRLRLTIDDILPLHGTFVLFPAELVLHGETPRLGLVIDGVGRHVAVDARVYAVCGEVQNLLVHSF